MSGRTAPARLHRAREMAAAEYEVAADTQPSLVTANLHRATAAAIRAGLCDTNTRVRHHLAEQSA